MRRWSSRRLWGAAGVLSVVAVAAAVLVLVNASSGSGRPHLTRPVVPASFHGPSPLDARPTAISHRTDKPLSLDQLAGQRIIYAYSGLNPPPSLLARIRAGEAGGVILFGPNVSSRSQVHAVVKRLQKANAASPVHAPLLILVDQEGGEVRRLPGAPTLSERQIGESQNAVQVAAAAGSGAGENLAGAAINVNLSPVLDVFRQPGNFIDQYGRSYSSNPHTVARLGRAFIASQQGVGVAATAKHFPGLGAAAVDQDTDTGPVTLHLSLKQLRSDDEVPYRSAIAAGVKLVMTSWALYPALDPKLPAGLSPKIIQGELRGRLGFHGVTITDTIEAGALSRFGSLGKRGVLAAKAGADLIICSAINPDDNSPSQGVRVLKAIASAIAHGQLSKAAAQAGAARVRALRLHP